jgi:hypothetical protein
MPVRNVFFCCPSNPMVSGPTLALLRDGRSRRLGKTAYASKLGRIETKAIFEFFSDEVNICL